MNDSQAILDAIDNAHANQKDADMRGMLGKLRLMVMLYKALDDALQDKANYA